MKSDIRIKPVIIYSSVVLIILMAMEFYFDFNLNFLYKYIDALTSRQKVAPERLFVNVWRTLRNEYFDDTMNAQDWQKWRHRYLKHIKTAEDMDLAVNSMIASLNDPYTKFLRSDLYKKQKDVMDSKVTGIGIIINKTGDNIIISHVVENSPAQKSNILSGDILISINSIEVNFDNVDKIIADCNHQRKKSIKIKIKRNNDIIEKTIKRAKIPLKTMEYRAKDGIGVITLATIMGEEALNDFAKILEEANKAKGIVIDLRDNYGGVLSNAIEMADFMLDNEKIVSIESRSSNKFNIYAANGRIYKNKNIVILVNRNTASAAEILAGSLKDNLGAVIVGENTFGKNSIQQVIPMSDNTGLVVTSNRYILPQGEDIHGTGITPDYYETDRYSQMNRALKILKDMIK